MSIKEDSDQKYLVRLDNGINCINLHSPIRNYKDDDGYLGTVYASVKYQDKIYLGTNQGLFYRNISDKGRFNFIRELKVKFGPYMNMTINYFVVMI